MLKIKAERDQALLMVKKMKETFLKFQSQMNAGKRL